MTTRLKPRRTRMIMVHPMRLERLASDVGHAGPQENYRLTTCDGVHFCVVSFVPSYPGQRADQSALMHLAGNVLVQEIAGKVRRGEPA